MYLKSRNLDFLDAINQVVPPCGLISCKNDNVINFLKIKHTRWRLPVNSVCMEKQTSLQIIQLQLKFNKQYSLVGIKEKHFWCFGIPAKCTSVIVSKYLGQILMDRKTFLLLFHWL